MNRGYLLDTNAYYLFFQKDMQEELSRLSKQLKIGENTCFFLSEISSLEIHSVLGKYRRGVQSQTQQCERTVILEERIQPCQNTWIARGRKKLNPKVFRDMRKMISDIESKKGFIQAEIIPLEREAISTGMRLLMDYADRHSLGSHDALIAGSLINARQQDKNLDLILVTSDKALKAVLSSENVPFLDPLL